MNVYVLNRGQAERTIFPWDAAVISIYSHGDEPAKINATRCIHLQFDDMDRPFEGMILFNKNQAKQIWDFVNKCKKEDCRNIVVHCDAGLSRSPAVALALREEFTEDRVIPNAWKMYNRLVYKIMKDVRESMR